MSDNYLLKLYHKCTKYPAGKWLFSVMFARKAPYFASIKPYIEELRPNYCRLTFKKRRAVQNHIGTVHAIAVCNGMEMAMGALAEASIPASLRWLPKGMNVEYLAKTTSDVTVEATATPATWQVGDQPITVEARRDDGTLVAKGQIIIYISAKK
ncbi:thioesterase [Idiomarina sp. OT37-5b]|jgi:acyl-coenzyme A thioesterase PaaI-like protein|uniref:Thioesterase n=1 Tax=Idiomarina aquatica TaxID=1327752 RepID=A0AA94JD21_9GAMM|nr:MULTISPECIES: hotdog fold domain-containing protein [Idiomarina]AVJ56103.1 thioesterase [Idiomarina sp. OT37-5b]RUO43374.1 thioesterase [Idiomarina aquatica]